MSSTYVVEDDSAPPLLLRALWFIFVGFWLGGIVTGIAWFLNVTIIGLPLGLWIINRIPTVMTLRPMHHMLIRQRLANGAEVIRVADQPQAPFVLRAIWFLLIGWWLSGLWAGSAYIAALTIIGIPLSFWMYDRLPAVTTLFRY
ncbi:MAG TPA: YccF domain-containing protein [Chloroflexota bacterium]|nr:YccF domain-containing protein [Chloroflexota bacterium]